MNQHTLIQQISPRMKLIRIERGYTQERMADVLGISKKTLVQIEKGRVQAGWTTIVAVTALFRDSEIIQHELGDSPIEVVELIAHEYVNRPKSRTLAGKVWWEVVHERGEFRLQQHTVTKHYRILDCEHYRWFSTTDYEQAIRKLMELSEQ
ncbi:XRE family transcriptional regulator [Pontibacillus halophilus JSM 076056 = DSM 19796]|uniref:XRE family transcriptional regulator n=1 Tax=Pontibacillus halophilus JSM 076056 = DSM 19796 TaxID=1385510 RepID=A0A0A5GG20_9BACI|nr:helix-turn-helix domain-containing protein [Pontibacillus halophilus]KGX92196.1 XRE family transcriptional regulator [Pontibacillus halophilus JSM 076056 = DSM 19796]